MRLVATAPASSIVRRLASISLERITGPQEMVFRFLVDFVEMARMRLVVELRKLLCSGLVF